MNDCEHDRVQKPLGTHLLICIDCGRRWKVRSGDYFFAEVSTAETVMVEAVETEAEAAQRQGSV